MASGGVGSSTIYSGTVEHVVKGFGFISLIGGNPVPKAFFDRSSIGRAVDDLTERFSKGCKVKARIAETDGSHKVKFKAIRMTLANEVDTGIRGGDHYLRKYLLDEGPEQLEGLVKILHNSTGNCPKFLKKGDENDVRRVVASRPDWFEIKNDFVCLVEVEEEIYIALLQNMATYNYKIPYDTISAIIRPDHEHRKYLHASGPWNNGIKDFVSRNAQRFVFWDNALWPTEYLKGNTEYAKTFQGDLAAVKYYSEFVMKKGSLSIASLSGHFNQASVKVKKVANPKESDFKEFLERNSFFFVMRSNVVQECPSHRISVIDSHWAKSNAQKRGKAKSKAPTTPTHCGGPVSPTAPKAPIQVSKAFSDFTLNEELGGKKVPLPPSRKTQQKSHVTRLSFETSVNAESTLLQPQNLFGSGSGIRSEGIYFSLEAAIFKKVIGETISRAIEDQILSGDTLNSLLLLRLNIGKPPMARFRIPGEGSGLNHILKVDPVKSEDIQRMLRHGEVKKMNTPSHYGVKGTLHSIWTKEQGGKLTGLTLFCQLHESNDGLGLDIWKGKKFTAIFTGNYPKKYIYNHMRCRSEKLSKRGDVLVIDVDGELSGCDEQTHSSLGDVTRMLCSSSQLHQVILESIQHMHEYVFVIGIDAVDQLTAVQKMCSKDTQVIAEVASGLKSDVETMFA